MNLPLTNIRARRVVCNCDVHAGDTIEQIDGQLPDGRPVAIMRDWRGFHVAIGARNMIGQFPYSQPISEAEAERLILEATR